MNYDVIISDAGRLEAPTLWGEDRLLVSDVTGGGVSAVDLATGAIETVVPHRRGIGGIALHAAGIVVTGRNVALCAPRSGIKTVLLDAEQVPGVLGFNDVVADADGRLYVGTLGFVVADGYETAKPAPLLRIDLDGSVSVIDADLLLANGVGLSPDSSTLYACDSLRRHVFAYRRHPDGQVGERRIFASIDEGVVDGMAIGADGSVWVAAAHAGRIHIFEPDGGARDRMEFDMPMVTSLCFGRSGETCIYVTTGPEDAPAGLGGAILRVETDAVVGAPVHEVRVTASVAP